MASAFLTFDAPFNVEHRDAGIDLTKGTSSVAMRLFGGDDILRSECVIGYRKDRRAPIVAEISLPYHYDCLRSELELWCDPEFPEASPSLRVRGISENDILIKCGGVHNAADSLSASYADKLSVCVGDVVSEVREAAARQGVDCFVHYEIKAPYKNALVVCEKGKPLRFFDEETDSDNLPLKPITSTRVVAKQFPANQRFVNVIGSTRDPKPDPYKGKSWLGLWESLPGFNYPSGQRACCCAVKEASLGHVCNDPNPGWLVGAHVVKGTLATKRQFTETDGTSNVFIIPACKRLNNAHNTQFKTPPASAYSNACFRWNVVQLIGFLN
jgi:hypothetical protein